MNLFLEMLVSFSFGILFDSVWYQNVPQIRVLSSTHDIVLVQYWHVMDGQTDTRQQHILRGASVVRVVKMRQHKHNLHTNVDQIKLHQHTLCLLPGYLRYSHS